MSVSSFAKSQQAHNAQILSTLGTDVVNPDCTGALQIDISNFHKRVGKEMVILKFSITSYAYFHDR